MRTNVAERTVTTHAGESAAFTISNNAKIFRILIDGLYADKIQSITREIWSNALDAHVAAGCADRPFDVSFPTVFDPTFRVRDYGVSLTHDQVMHLYTDLGNSTKEDTNDAVGKFGIGSKSPFAYTDNFTVTVWKGGEKRYYSAMIGSNGVPAIHLMGVEETTEENGVEVAFPVESSDTRAFQNAAKRVSHGFDVKPNVVGSDFGGWPELDVLLEGEGWKLLKGQIEGYQDRAYARMGPVLYPINANALTNLTAEESQLLQHTFVIDFPMGALEITASREELAYGRNDPTADSIKQKLAIVAAEVEKIARDQLEGAATYFEACIMFREITNNTNLPEIVRDIVREKAVWKGRELLTHMHIDLWGSSAASHVIRGQKLSNKAYKLGAQTVVEADPKTVIMVEDLTGDNEIKKAGERIRTYYYENKAAIRQIIWLRVYSTRGHNAEKLAEFFDTFDGIPVVNVGDLPEPVVVRRGGYSGPRRKVEARRYCNSKWEERIALSEEDFKAGGVFLPLERNNPLVSPGETSPDHLIRCLRRVGALTGNVIGVPKSMSKKFEGAQWVNLYDFARDWFKKQDFDFSSNYARRAAVKDVLNDKVLEFLGKYRDAVEESALLRDALDLRERATTDNTPDSAAMRDLGSALRIDLGLDREVKDDFAVELELYREEIEAKYPLIPVLASAWVSNNDTMLDKLAQYVNMCDTVSETNHQVALAA